MNRKDLIDRLQELYKDEDSRVTVNPHAGQKVAIVYPNTYFVGMSNLGLHIIYEEINLRNDSVCERIFLPEMCIRDRINKGLVLRGRIFTFSVNLPDKPGQLVAVSQMLADADANVIKLDHNQFKNLDRFHEVELQVTVETNGEEHIQHIIDCLLYTSCKSTFSWL